MTELATLTSDFARALDDAFRTEEDARRDRSWHLGIAPLLRYWGDFSDGPTIRPGIALIYDGCQLEDWFGCSDVFDMTKFLALADVLSYSHGRLDPRDYRDVPALWPNSTDWPQHDLFLLMLCSCGDPGCGSYTAEVYIEHEDVVIGFLRDQHGRTTYAHPLPIRLKLADLRRDLHACVAALQAQGYEPRYW